jgi:hypothetical protein
MVTVLNKLRPPVTQLNELPAWDVTWQSARVYTFIVQDDNKMLHHASGV